MRKTLICLALATLMMNHVQAQSDQPVWTGTWATAVEWTGPSDMPKASLSNRSLREIIHVSREKGETIEETADE